MPSTSGAVEASLTFVVLGRELGVALYPKDGTPSLSLHLDHPVTASAPLAPFFARSALPRKRVRSLAPKGTCSGITRRLGFVESPGGISPPGAPRTVHDPLESHGFRCSAVAMSNGFALSTGSSRCGLANGQG